MKTKTIRPIFSGAAALALIFLGAVAAPAQEPPSPTPEPTPPPAPPAATYDPAKRAPVDPKDTIAVIRSTGKLRVCVALLPPWVMTGEDGKLQGFSIDVATRLAQDLAVEPEWVTTGYVDLPVALDGGDCQVIISGVSATPERALFASFTNPIRTYEIRLSPSQRRAAWKSPLDFNRPDVTIGAMESSMSLEWARKVYTKAKVVPIPGINDLLEAAMEDRFDAIVATSPGPELLAKVSGKMGAPLETPVGKRTESLAVHRGDPEFLNYLNTWIQSHLDDDFFAERGDYWLTKLSWLPPPDTSRAPSNP